MLRGLGLHDDLLGAVLNGADNTIRLVLYSVDTGLDLLGRVGRVAGQIADLRRNSGKASPMLASSRRRDGRSERQQVCLGGDVRDELHDRTYLLAALA